MGDNASLDLSAILIMVGIFIPVLIEKFYLFLGGDFINRIPNVSLHYISLAGFYMIIYCLVYFLKKEDVVIRRLLITNILFAGFVTIMLSDFREILNFSPAFVVLMQIFMGITFVVVPAIILFIALFKLTRSWQKKAYS